MSLLPKKLWTTRPDKSNVQLPQFQSSHRNSAESSSTIAGEDEVSADDGTRLLEKEPDFPQLPFPRQRSILCRSRYTSTFLIVFVVLVSAILCTTAILILSCMISIKSLSSLSSSSVESLTGQPGLKAPFQPVPRLRHCGTNADEARSLGCRFQIWSYSWVPPECYDEELVQDWLNLRDWEYYDDRYGKGKVVNFTTEVLQGKGDRLLYSTWGQHYWHCAFSWRKFLRAALGSGVGITDQDLDYHHANHCQDTIRNKPDYRPWDENDIQLTVGFHRC